jgi:hypothetical protein
MSKYILIKWIIIISADWACFTGQSECYGCFTFAWNQYFTMCLPPRPLTSALDVDFETVSSSRSRHQVTNLNNLRWGAIVRVERISKSTTVNLCRNSAHLRFKLVSFTFNSFGRGRVQIDQQWPERNRKGCRWTFHWVWDWLSELIMEIMNDRLPCGCQ